MTIDKGQVISQRYRIVSLLGQGGFGAVYRAWDLNLNRPCALKENLGLSEDARRQFEREAQLLANLSHPGLPRVIDHFVIKDQGQYLVMDYIEGDDLRQILEQSDGPLPESQVIAWALQVSDALHYLHSQKPAIIHRDIKPANIKITPQGKAVLVDFGIAKVYDPNLRTTLGARAVTPGYSPPEQYGQGQTDVQSDVYALGATLYTLLTGQVPPDSVDIVTGNTKPPLSVISINPSVSPAVSAAITQAMNTNRTNRLRSMRELQAALQGRLSLSPEAVAVKQTQTAPAGRALPVSPVRPVYPSRDRSAPPDSRPPGSQQTALPVSHPAKPRSRSLPWLVFIFGAGFVLVIGVAGLFGIIKIFNPATKTPVPTGLSNLPTDTMESIIQDTQVSYTPVPTITMSPSPTPEPSATPTPSEPFFIMPQSRLAFVSDHRMDGKERIFIIDLTGGGYVKDQLFGLQPFSKPQQLPALEPYDMAWWPDWCGGNQTIFFEVQDMDEPDFQTVAYVASDGSGNASGISLPALGKLGVPRCSYSGNQVLISTLTNPGKNLWELYSYNIHTQTADPVGSDYTLAGYASWASDDSWFVFMDKYKEGSFYLVRMLLNTYTKDTIQVPASIVDRKYPTVSPVNGDIVFACYDKNWNLCRVDKNLGNYQVLLTNLVDMSNKRSAPKRIIPAVTPVWSPDGIWLAYASNKDGDWDIYLYSSEYEIELNLTQGLGGDQFQPAWSKP